ncbi:type IV secretion protein Rhs [Burkholderia sp. BE17]|nr:type IV secretion protein Rhs [Burkholderia sp. BE17]
MFLPHPHVGFMLDLREYVQAAKAVVGCIAMMIVQEKVTEYIEDHPEDVEKLAHLADEANQQVNDLMGGGKLPDFKDDPNVAEGMRLANEANKIKNRISDDLGSNVGSGGSSGRPIFVNGMMRATAGTHAYHVPGLHFPLGEAFAPPPEEVEPSNDGESFMGSKTVLANNDPMSYMALEALSCWSVGMEPPPHNSAHTDRTYPSMPSSVMLPIPAGRPVLVGGPPIMNMAAAAKGLFKAFRGSDWAKALADKLHLKSGFLRCNVLKAEPVDVTTGEVVVQQCDFTISGRLPLVWDRYYTSHDHHAGAVGFGWQTPADIRLELMRNEDAIGAAAYFPDHATAFDVVPADDGWAWRTYDWQHGHALYCDNGRMVLRTREGIEYGFALPSRWRDAVPAINGNSRLTLPIERVADLNGNAWVFERDVYGTLVRLVEWKSDGQTERLIQCGTGRGLHAGLLTSLMLIDAGGNAHPLVRYDHDRERDLTAALDALARPHHFEYAAGHRMVSHTSARGVSFYYSYQQGYDGVWRVDYAWGDNGLFDYHFAYDRARLETCITNSLGHTTIMQMNEREMPVTEIDPLGGVTGYRYDAQGRTSAMTDPAGHMTTWAYDAYGNQLEQTLPDGSVILASYGAHHKPVIVTAPGDRQWRYEWDEQGKLLAQSTPTRSRMCYEYDRHGQLIAHTGSRGAVTCFDYDHDGNLTEVIDALGHRTRYTYDARANLCKTVNALGQVSLYEYDRNGNLTRTIEPGERETVYSYDLNGNLTRYRDPNGHVTQLEYSALGQIAKRLTPDGCVVEYRYDTEEQLVGLVNERGELYQLTRDALGRIVEEVDYWGQPRRYEYRPSGELLCSVNPLGQVVEYETDMLGRIVKKRVSDPRQPEGIRTETLSYDRSGNLIVAENPDSRVELAYDVVGRVVEEKQGNDFVIAHKYDATGNRIERQTRLNLDGQIVTHTVRYSYDALDAVSSIQMDDATPVTFERDALGQIRVEHLGAELRRELTYTSEGLLAKQALVSGTGVVFASEYAYDADGQMLESRDSRLGLEHYQYDPVGRLTSHLDPTGKLHRFLYDPAGDLLKTRICQGKAIGMFSQGLQADTWIREGEYEGCYYAFDCIGNLVRRQDAQQDLRLRWDGDGLLIETIAARQAPEADGDSSGTLTIRTCYAYDVFQRRVRKTSQILGDIDTRLRSTVHSTQLACTTYFMWDGEALAGERTQGDLEADNALLNKTSHTGSRQFRALEHAGSLSAELLGRRSRPDARLWIYYPGTFRPLAEVWCTANAHKPGLLESTEPFAEEVAPSQNMRDVQGQVERYNRTGRKSASQLSLKPGALPELEALYFFHLDPNGMPTRVTDKSGSIMWGARYLTWGQESLGEDGEAFDQPIRFQGQYHDNETGLHYNRYRYYDPFSGTFVSEDPIGWIAGHNLYQYAPNPYTWIDPWGLAKGRSKPYTISANVAGTDTLSHGAHVNVKGGKLPNRGGHVMFLPNANLNATPKVTLHPADKATRDLNPAEWSKVTQAIEEFLNERDNVEKLRLHAISGRDNFKFEEHEEHVRILGRVAKALGKALRLGENPCQRSAS